LKENVVESEVGPAELEWFEEELELTDVMPFEQGEFGKQLLLSCILDNLPQYLRSREGSGFIVHIL
jgi:hypothetical protein